jgi:hypothetical protein
LKKFQQGPVKKIYQSLLESRLIKVCLNFFQQGLHEKPDYVSTVALRSNFRFRQTWLTFHEQGLLKIFSAKSD